MLQQRHRSEAVDLMARPTKARTGTVARPVRRIDAWTNAAPALRLARDYLRHADPRYAHKTKLEALSKRMHNLIKGKGTGKTKKDAGKPLNHFFR